jgi:mRNA interferase HigB
MHIITKRRLREFWQQYPDAKAALQGWYQHAAFARWRHFADVRQTFPTADQVSHLTVFNVGGNKYRLVVRIEFEKQRVYIRRVMTHAEYDKDKWKNDS